MMYQMISAKIGGNVHYGIQGNGIDIVEVTLDKARAVGLVHLCNQNALSVIHIYDVIEDWFGCV